MVFFSKLSFCGQLCIYNKIMDDVHRFPILDAPHETIIVWTDRYRIKAHVLSVKGHRSSIIAISETGHYQITTSRAGISHQKFTTKTEEHYSDVIMGAMAFQITSLTIVYSTVYSGADQGKHQSSASVAFVRGIHRGPVNSPHKWPVTRKMFPFDDAIMTPADSPVQSTITLPTRKPSFWCAGKREWPQFLISRSTMITVVARSISSGLLVLEVYHGLSLGREEDCGTLGVEYIECLGLRIG